MSDGAVAELFQHFLREFYCSRCFPSGLRSFLRSQRSRWVSPRSKSRSPVEANAREFVDVKFGFVGKYRGALASAVDVRGARCLEDRFIRLVDPAEKRA